MPPRNVRVKTDHKQSLSFVTLFSGIGISENIKGKIFGDKGYISQKLAESLLQRGVRFITNLRANMKNRLLLLQDKILLRKRSLIETVFGQMKNVLQIQHTRHRSPLNGFANLVAALVAFCFYPNKPKIKFNADHSSLATLSA